MKHRPDALLKLSISPRKRKRTPKTVFAGEKKPAAVTRIAQSPNTAIGRPSPRISSFWGTGGLPMLFWIHPTKKLSPITEERERWEPSSGTDKKTREIEVKSCAVSFKNSSTISVRIKKEIPTVNKSKPTYPTLLCAT